MHGFFWSGWRFCVTLCLRTDPSGILRFGTFPGLLLSCVSKQRRPICRGVRFKIWETAISLPHKLVEETDGGAAAF